MVLDCNCQMETESSWTRITRRQIRQDFFEMISVSSNESREWQDLEEKLVSVRHGRLVKHKNERTLSKVLPLIPTSFEKGIIGGMSTNNFLMIKGLIDPRLYVQFMHLELFSQQ
jgi:hypothetical protein